MIDPVTYLSFFQTGLPDSAFDRIKDYYMARMADEDELKWSKLYGEAMGDIFFVTPAIKTAQHHDGTEIEKFVHLESADYTPDVHIGGFGGLSSLSVLLHFTSLSLISILRDKTAK